jgi:secreted PhoX family phosphatase
VEVCEGGWLFTADDPPSLATQMEQLARDGRLAAWRVDATALARFTHVAVAEAHAAIYASLTHNHGRRE